MAGDDGQPDHRVLVDPDEPAGLPHATTLLQMFQHGEGFVLGEFGAIQRRAFAFGEAFLAGPTGQDAALLVGTIAEANPQITEAPSAIVRALRVLAAKEFQVVHGSFWKIKAREESCRSNAIIVEKVMDAASLIGHDPTSGPDSITGLAAPVCVGL